MREFTLLGLTLRDYSAREALCGLSAFMNNGICNTIDYVTQDVMLMASSDKSLRRNVEAMDMTVFTSPDILRVGGMDSREREEEIESNLFLKEMLKKFSSDGTGIFLIAPSEPELSGFESDLLSMEEGLRFEGGFSGAGPFVSEDKIINEINSCLPDVVLLRLPSPQAEKFVADNRMKMNTHLVVILRESSFRNEMDGGTRKETIKDMIRKKLFSSAAKRYEKE